ncbi:MAG TPA: hypothetical protein VFV66_16845 [Nonomuraea sp.]|nr:hypothetical protein [Nonomuraea sp.]
MTALMAGSVAVLVAVLSACGGEAGTGAAASGGATAQTTAPSTAPATPASSGTTTPGTGGSPTPSSPPPSGPSVSGCYYGTDGKLFTHGDDLPGLIGGKGPVGVVISYERRGNACTWRPLFDRLVGAGFRVLVYARASADVPEDATVAMGKRLAKEKGVKRLFLVGGSIGATTAVPAAAKLGEKVAGVVALSGQISAEHAAALTVPLLQVGSANDDYGGADDVNAARAAAAKAPDNQILIIPGESLHASQLFASPHAEQVLGTIEAFMSKHSGGE